MKIAVISDIHDNIENLEKCLKWCNTKKIKLLICCGDIAAEDTLNYLATFSGKILIAAGNAELFAEDILKKYPRIKYYKSEGKIKINKLNIGFCHETKKIKNLLDQSSDLTQTPFDFIFYGHTHKPWIEKKDKVIIANPGNIAGLFYQATFATLDTSIKKLELHLLASL